MQLTLSDIERAWALKDPDLVNYIVSLADQDDPEPEILIRDEALTFDRFLQTIFSGEFAQKTYEEKKAYRIEQLRLLEADDAEVPLPERLKLHKIILLLWADESPYARSVLIDVIRKVPLVYGPWKALKHIFKAAESSSDYQILGEISVRFDKDHDHDLSDATVLYMRRRSWRYLRKLGESLPVCYPDAAIHFLAAYPADTQWQQTWVANHIFHHQGKQYGSARFSYLSDNENLLKNRAFATTWQRTAEPLLRLLMLAHSNKVREFATRALKQDFNVMLRDINPAWIISLSSLAKSNRIIDHFIVWLLKNASTLEQQQFRELGLHSVVLDLLESNDNSAQNYAIAYVKSHARDLSLHTLKRLSSNNSPSLIKLVQLLIAERDPRKAIGLAFWGDLLALPSYYQFASKALIQHFGRKELTPEWFKKRLIEATTSSFKFANKNLPTLHSLNSLGLEFFLEIAEQLDPDQRDFDYGVVEFVLINMKKIGVAQLPTEFIQMALLHPLFEDEIIEWLNDSVIKPDALPLDYYQALVYEPDWKTHPFIQQLKASDKKWAQQLNFNESLAEEVREWLLDVRRFTPADLGFEWLMSLVDREESEYHDFAVELMIKAFLPADFATQQDPTASIEGAPSADKIETTIDLAQQTYLFTGKLKAMTRKQAQTMVSDANGLNHKAVNNKLNYLVIGDEGSPMYGHGRKGSKQLKAETLIEKGADLKVISETAFLQMMSGEQREFSTDSILDGCQNLWSMLTEKPDTPISKFAMKYIRHHHPDICLKETDRPVDPNAAIPAEFLSFEQFKPLLQQNNRILRRFALAFCHYEFARWQVPSANLIELCESKYIDIREFVVEALLAEPEEENKGYRIDASQLETSAVYSFCESKKPETRQLGMQIIQKHDKFQQPDALFQLTESPDRELRSFVVRILWSLYRRYSTTEHWQPRLAVMGDMRKKDRETLADKQKKLGSGLPPRPENLPADISKLQTLLRRWLYELPPGRLSAERIKTGLKPLSASTAKKALIETFRDIALDDEAFAAMVLPLFENFTQSRGAMEQAACLVAVTRIHHAHPQFAEATAS